MNPLMDALKEVEDAGPAPVSQDVDEPSGPASPLEWPFKPIRATSVEADSGAVSPPVPDADELPDLAAPRQLSLDPIRAMRDDADSEVAALDLGLALSASASSPEPAPSGRRFGNTGVPADGLEHAMNGSAARDALSGGTASRALSLADDGTAGGGTSIMPPSAEAAQAPVESRSGDLPNMSMPAEPTRATVDDVEADRHRLRWPSREPPDTRTPGSTTHRAFDPETLPTRRGVGRAIGVVLAFLTVIGIGAGGGYHLWKTHLVRPALVRRLPPTPSPVLDLTPVHSASAAPSVARESGAGVAIRPERRPAVSIPEGAEASPARLVAGVPTSERVADKLPPATAEAPTSDVSRTVSVAGSAVSGNTEGLTMPARGDLAPRYIETASSARHMGRTPSSQHDHVSIPQEPEPLESGPAPSLVEPIIRAATDSFAGAVGPPARATERNDMELRPVPGAGIEISQRVRSDHVAVSLERAYEAFRGGHAESAAEAYRAVLGHEPRNRNALLGLAAVAARAGRWDEAVGHYAQVLVLHPADTVAQAALVAIDEQDPARGESRLKALLWSEPQAAHLHFNLGNVYAAQSRWPEAQQSYFNAYRFDSGNADYAHNLAVSLDHLSRRESALDFYREALALARSRPASFETEAVLARIRDIDPPRRVGFTPTRPSSEPDGAAPAASIR